MIKGSSAVALEPLNLLPCVVAGQDLNLRPLGYERPRASLCNAVMCRISLLYKRFCVSRCLRVSLNDAMKERGLAPRGLTE